MSCNNWLRFKNVKDNADATSNYEVSIQRDFTVLEFIREYLPRQYEWGYVTIDKPWGIAGDENFLLEYNDDTCLKLNRELLAVIGNKTVTKITASGGWTRMDYTLYFER